MAIRRRRATSSWVIGQTGGGGKERPESEAQRRGEKVHAARLQDEEGENSNFERGMGQPCDSKAKKAVSLDMKLVNCQFSG